MASRGWIESRPNGRYRARYKAPDGSIVSETFDLKGRAREWLNDQLGDLSRGSWVNPRLARQPFIEWADEWAAAQDTWKATSTAEQWSSVRKRLDTRIGRVPIGAVDAIRLKRLRAELGEVYAPNTVTLTMAYVRMILRAAYASRRIGWDPTQGLRHKRARADEPEGQVGPDDVLTRAEALAILTGAPARFRAGVALGMAGLRVGEVLGMTADRLDLERRLVTVDRQSDNRRGWTTPKVEKVRTIEVPGVVAVELRRHLRDYSADGVLFRGPRTRGRGRTMTRSAWYEQAWWPALVEAGLYTDVPGEDERTHRFVFHALRHWCASTLLAEGAPITAVAGHLGDTVETVMRTYAHWLREDRDVPAGVLDRVLAPPERGAHVARDGAEWRVSGVDPGTGR
jgi:integrase